jgi:hypothetical protein
LAAEFFERMKVFGEKFDSSVFYDPEGSAPTKRGKTVHGYGVQFLADVRFGLVWSFAVFPAGECTKGQNPRMLCIHVYREDLGIHAARMQADPPRTLFCPGIVRPFPTPL